MYRSIHPTVDAIDPRLSATPRSRQHQNSYVPDLPKDQSQE
jgi:hypothetical protein